MKLFNQFFSGSEANPSALQWQALQDEHQLSDIIQESHQQPVAIFKHSIRCGISAMVKHQLEQTWDFSSESMKIYYLDLIQYRAVSNAVASTFQVPHQSPQLIIIDKGEVIYHASHHAISTASVHQRI